MLCACRLTKRQHRRRQHLQAGTYGLKVIEDATEALGTKYTEGCYAGRYAGTIGDFGCFSFNGNKIITTGGGGAVTARASESCSQSVCIWKPSTPAGSASGKCARVMPRRE